MERIRGRGGVGINKKLVDGPLWRPASSSGPGGRGGDCGSAIWDERGRSDEVEAEDVGSRIQQEGARPRFLHDKVESGIGIAYRPDAQDLEMTIIRLREPVDDGQLVFVNFPFTMADHRPCVDRRCSRRKSKERLAVIVDADLEEMNGTSRGDKI